MPPRSLRQSLSGYRLSNIFVPSETGRSCPSDRHNVVQPTDSIRELGVLLDSELTMKHHVNKTVFVFIISDGYGKSDATWTGIL